MIRPDDSIIELVAPSRDIDRLQIADGYTIRNCAHAELRDSLRIPRGGPHDTSLVATRRSYDGSAGGEPGVYLMAWIEFRCSGSRWRTVGSKIRQVEAARIARALVTGKASKPGKGEAPRVGGKTEAVAGSELRGAPVPGGYALFVRYVGRSGAYVRTRGVELLTAECAIVAGLLKQLAAEGA